MEKRVSTGVARLLEVELGPQSEWPLFTEAQAEWLAKVFPPRCIARHEPLEDHLRYAGAVEVVEIIKSRVPGSIEAKAGLDLTEDEEMELEAIRQAVARQPDGGTT